MTRKVKDLSPDQKIAIESLLERAIPENEEITISTRSLIPLQRGCKHHGRARENRVSISFRWKRLRRR